MRQGRGARTAPGDAAAASGPCPCPLPATGPGRPLHSPVVASRHPIRVEHGNELEDKHPPQHLGAGVLLAQDEVQEAVEDKAGRRLPGVHPAAQEEHLGEAEGLRPRRPARARLRGRRWPGTRQSPGSAGHSSTPRAATPQLWVASVPSASAPSCLERGGVPLKGLKGQNPMDPTEGNQNTCGREVEQWQSAREKP